MPARIVAAVPDESAGIGPVPFSPQWLQQLQQNWAAKKVALASGDRKEWERVIAEEEQTLREMAE